MITQGIAKYGDGKINIEADGDFCAIEIRYTGSVNFVRLNAPMLSYWNHKLIAWTPFGNNINQGDAISYNGPLKIKFLQLIDWDLNETYAKLIIHNVGVYNWIDSNWDSAGEWETYFRRI